MCEILGINFFKLPNVAVLYVFPQEAEKMVAALQDTSLEEECFTQTLQESRNTAAALPLSHDSAMKWFYKDPQGEIQGRHKRAHAHTHMKQAAEMYL